MLNAANARTATARTATAKTVAAYVLAAALALSPAVALAAPATGAKLSRTEAAQSAYIGAKKAKSIALKDAGFKEKQCRYVDVELDLDPDDGPAHYDVDFKVDSREFEYDINAVTGEIMSHEVEVDD